MSNEKVAAKLETIEQSSGLANSLILTSSKVRDESLDSIASTLAKNKNVVHLNLTNNALSASSSMVLAEILKQNRLKSMLLSANQLGCQGAIILAEGLKQNTSLEVLEIARNGCGDEGINAICKAIRQHPNIRSLNFAQNTILDKHPEAWLSLKKVTKLEYLDLSKNQVGDRSCFTLKQLLEESNLKHLNLASNQLNDESVIELCSGLKSSELLSLDLSNNKFNFEGIEALSDVLANDPKLKSINLASMKLDDKCGVKLAEMLWSNKNLKELNLANNCLLGDSATEFAEALKYNGSLEVFTQPNMPQITPEITKAVNFLAQYNGRKAKESTIRKQITDKIGEIRAAQASERSPGNKQAIYNKNIRSSLVSCQRTTQKESLMNMFFIAIIAIRDTNLQKCLEDNLQKSEFSAFVSIYNECLLQIGSDEQKAGSNLHKLIF